MKRKRLKRIFSVLLTFAMCITMIPAQAFAESAEEPAVLATNNGGWRFQQEKSAESREPGDGWINVSADGKNVTIDYTKVVADAGEERWIAYDSDAPLYGDSVLEYDITISDPADNQAGFLAMALLPRAINGGNYEGLNLQDNDKHFSDLEVTYRQNMEKAIYPKTANLSDITFKYGQKYHFRFETAGKHITVYCASQGTAEQKLIEYDSAIELDKSSYGFFLWRGGKKVTIENIERTPAGADAVPYGGWRFQQEKSAESQEPQEGWIDVSSDGKNVTIDYTKVVADAGERWIAYDSDAPLYGDSVLEYDVKLTEPVDSGQGGYLETTLLHRALDGGTFEGFNLRDNNKYYNIQEMMYRQNMGGLQYLKPANLTDIKFEYEKFYHFKFETVGKHTIVYCTPEGGTEQKFTEYDSAADFGKSTYGFFIRRGGKKLVIENIERREIVQEFSKLNQTEAVIPFDEWCKGFFNIPVTIADGDSIASIEDTEMVLTAGSHYTVFKENGVIEISNDYLKDKGDRDKLVFTITFESGVSGVFTMIRAAKPGAAYGGWVFTKDNDDKIIEAKEGWITVSEDGKNVTIDYGKVVKDDSERWAVYDSDAPKYKNSILEYDITFKNGEQAPWIATVICPRMESGKNYEGLTFTQSGSLERGGNKGGSENYAGIDNLAKIDFKYDTKYHFKIETVDSSITVWVTPDGGKETKLAAFDSPIGLEESTYGFRFWRGGKKLVVENIERTEIITSSLKEGMVRVSVDDWGKTDVSTGIKYGREDALASVFLGDKELTAGTDYVVNGDTLTLKPEFVSKQEKTFSIVVNFAQGSSDSLWVVKFDPNVRQEYTWTPDQGVDMWMDMLGGNNFELTEDGKAMHVTGKSALVNTLAPYVVNGEVEIVFEALHDYEGHETGALFRSTTDNWQALASVDSINGEGVWNFLNGKGTSDRFVWDAVQNMSQDGVQDLHIKVRYVDDSLTFWIDDQYAHTQGVSKAEATLGGMGLYVDNRGDILVKKVIFREITPLEEETAERETETITNDGLSVRVDKDFPRVADYTLNGKTLNGAELRFNYVTINTREYPAAATYEKAADGKSLTYHVTPEGIDVTFDVVFTVKEDHIVEMLIKNIVEPEGTLVASIGLPDQPLISANSMQKDAKIDASWIDKNGRNFNDLHETVANKKISTTAGRTVNIPIVTANGLSASMMNNVLIGGDEFTLRAFNLENGEITAGFWNTDFMYRGVDGKKIFPFPSEPNEKDLYCRIAIAEDTNDDKVVDWQDGANALKKLNRHLIPGGDQAARSYFHVGNNFASVAQNPFLKIADDMKRLSNMLDGFSQQLVFKGYANEGHDSGHCDYEDINMRAGGAEDFRVAIEEADKINSNIGIHINVQEAYPEAKMFNDHVTGDRAGWSWVDSSMILRRYVDMLEGTFQKRLDLLYEQVPELDFVYVDCWGEDRWGEKVLIGNLLENGCEMFGNENAPDFNRFGVWVHSTSGNEHNSINQFVFNTQRDVYQGGGIYWGGYDRGGSMMSWHGGRDVNSRVEQFYRDQLPQKYLMCHEVLRTTNDTGYFSNNVTSGNYVITKDGKKLTDGQGKIFIPWYGEDSVNKDPDEAAKIYHWNQNGGKTTWDLPSNWENVTTVYLYENTQNGKVLADTIAVADHKVTIDAKAKTSYVVYPGKTESKDTEWSVGSPLKDTSFNSRDFSIWKKDAAADNVQFVEDNNHVSVLTITGTEENSVSQVMTGLVPGQKYRMTTWAGAANGKTARLTVTDGDKEYTAYLDKYTKNCEYVDHHAQGKPFQRMWVDFTATGTTATVTLKGEASSNASGKVTFMQNRIVKTAEPDLMPGYLAYETFEYVEQAGFGIFNPDRIVSGAPHLSQTHRPYTDDTINGDWSLDCNSRQGHVDVRTIPTVVRMQPNTEYTVEFQSLENGWVEVMSESNGSDMPLKRQSYNGGGNHKYTFTTGEANDYVVHIGTRVIDDFMIYEGTAQPPLYSEKPVIVKNPADLTVKEGEKAEFTVEASVEGEGTLSYQWQISTDGGKTWTDIDGATEASYTVETAKQADNGTQFRCVVTNTEEGNSAVNVTSGAATLIVEAISEQEKPSKPGNGGSNEHKHTGDGAWVSDSKDHWHICDCGEIIDKAAHTPDKNGECTVCHKTGLTPVNPGEGNGTAGGANTGDTMNMFPFVFLMGAAAAAFAVVKRRKAIK